MNGPEVGDYIGAAVIGLTVVWLVWRGRPRRPAEGVWLYPRARDTVLVESSDCTAAPGRDRDPILRGVAPADVGRFRRGG